MNEKPKLAIQQAKHNLINYILQSYALGADVKEEIIESYLKQVYYAGKSDGLEQAIDKIKETRFPKTKKHGKTRNY